MKQELENNLNRMKQHRVFSAVKDARSLQTFMQWHVFAVWDFMSLVKRLQRDLTCVSLPWMPSQFPEAARLINDIVLGEETDEKMGQSGHESHFEIYLQAMREVGASTAQIERFLADVTATGDVAEALNLCGAPQAVKDFVLGTMELAFHGKLEEVLGSFYYGREDVIPGMFQNLLADWTVDPASAPTFVYYLQRHIELDGDSHGPAARNMIADVLKGDAAATARLLQAADNAARSRIALWDALDAELRTRRQQDSNSVQPNEERVPA